MRIPRVSIVAVCICMIVSGFFLTGCYEKVVRDDSVESRMNRAVGANHSQSNQEEKKKGSWWFW